MPPGTHPPHRLNIDGTEVLIEGEGRQALVMIHGWPDTRALWTPQVAHFRDRFRCVRFTLPGFDPADRRRALGPAAMAAHIAAIVDAVSPDAPVVLMLHDWGAVYGYQVALRHPHRVARIVGIDVGDTTSAAFARAQPVRAQAGIAAYQGFLAVAWYLPAALGDPMTRWLAGRLRAPSPREAITAGMNHPYRALWTGGFRDACPVEPAAPMLYLWGTRKPFQFHTAAWVERLAARPGCAAQGLRAGHWVMVDQPAAFHRAVDDWLAAAGP